MSKITVASLHADVQALTEVVGSLATAVSAIVAEPASPSVKSRKRTYATKAEREAGNGFSCSCGRADLRVAPHAGSFHKAPDGTVHTVE